jgi:putative flippase GtrA
MIPNIIVINDGSNQTFDPTFEEVRSLGCTLVTHDTNQGKGAAIKTGIRYANQQFKTISSYITCDADGQHLAKDIFHLYEEANRDPYSLILGVRNQKLNHVPLKSRIGNAFSSFYFRISTGRKCPDTQTGLRVIPFSLTTDALELKENRYDYEMVFLTKIARKSFPIRFIPIETIYVDQNSQSHFKPIHDSVLIYKQPLRFAIASLSSAFIDLSIFTLLVFLLKGTLLQNVAIASVTARLISGYYNFLMNRLWSFNHRGHVKPHLLKYGILYVFQLLSSIFLVTLLSSLFKYITFVKLLVDGSLFVMSYFVQKHWVFKKRGCNEIK